MNKNEAKARITSILRILSSEKYDEKYWFYKRGFGHDINWGLVEMDLFDVINGLDETSSSKNGEE